MDLQIIEHSQMSEERKANNPLGPRGAKYYIKGPCRVCGGHLYYLSTGHCVKCQSNRVNALHRKKRANKADPMICEAA